MRFTKRRVAGAALAIGVIVLAILANCINYPEPSCRNRPLSYWLDVYITGASLSAADAGDAIRHIGTNAIPFLLHDMESRMPQVRLHIRKVFGNDRFIRIYYRTAQQRRGMAALGFHALGARAESAIPKLEELGILPAFAYEATLALSGMGSNAVPPLLRLLTHNDPLVRECAATAVGRGFTPPEFPDFETMSLGSTNDADRAVEALLSTLNDTNANVCEAVVSSLSSIERQPERVVQLLEGRLRQSDTACRTAIVEVLAKLKSITQK